MTSQDRTDGVLVAGYDGSPQAGAALRYALADARRRGLGVRVVTAYRRRDRWAEVCDLAFRVEFPDAAARAVAAAWSRVDEIVVAEPELHTVPVTVAAVGGSPADVLVAESRHTGGLVVGPGAVGLQCVLHAGCPVTVVPATAVPAGRAPAPA